VTGGGKRVSDFELERLVRGELPEAQAAALEARLREAGEEGRLEALRASDAAILEAHAPADVAREVRRRAVMQEAAEHAARRRRITGAFSLLGGFAAAAALWLVLRPAPPDGEAIVAVDEHVDIDGIRVRGAGPVLHVYRRTSREPEKLETQGRVKPGDVLQLRYLAQGDRFGFIASVDGRGAVSLHLPENGGPAAELQASGERALPHSYELDDSPGFERFVFVSSSEPFDTRPFAEALAMGKPMPARPVVHVTELTLIKETP